MPVDTANILLRNTLRYTAKVFWFTGLSGAGKSTLAVHTEKTLRSFGVPVVVLDGDRVRKGICSDLNFTEADRAENLRRISEIAALLVASDIVVLCSVIAPLHTIRNSIRKKFGSLYKEIFVNCPLAVCEERDVKGNYKKARQGLIKNYTGISSPYDVPQTPELIVATDKESVNVTASKVLDFVLKEIRFDRGKLWMQG